MNSMEAKACRDLAAYFTRQAEMLEANSPSPSDSLEALVQLLRPYLRGRGITFDALKILAETVGMPTLPENISAAERALLSVPRERVFALRASTAAAVNRDMEAMSSIKMPRKHKR